MELDRRPLIERDKEDVFRPGSSVAPRARFPLIGKAGHPQQIPATYIKSLSRVYGSLEGIDLAKEVLEVEDDESFRGAYLRRGRVLLEQSADELTFEEVTQTAEFQALTAAYEIMAYIGWKRVYEKHGLVSSLKGIKAPLLMDKSHSSEVDTTAEDAKRGRPLQSYILNRRNSWGSGAIALKKTTSNVSKKMSVRQRISRWNDQASAKQQFPPVAITSTKSDIVSPSSVMQDGFPAFLPDIDDDEDFFQTTQDSSFADESQSLGVAKELFKEMVRPMESRKKARKSPKKSKIHVEFAKETFEKSALEALMTEIPLSCEVSGHETLLDNPDAAESIDLGPTRSLPEQEAINMSSDATTKGYVRVERLDTPSVADTSAITFHSQGTIPKRVVPASTSFYNMLGVNSKPQGMVKDVKDIEFLTTIDGYVKTVADGIEGIGSHISCNLSNANKAIVETLTLPDEDVGGILEVLSVENESCEQVWKDFEKDLSNGTVFPTIHKSFTM